MKYNFSKIELLDIEGNKVEGHDIHKHLANGLYVGATDLDLVEKAMGINKGEEIELDKVEVEKIKEFINSDKCTLVAFAKKTILDFLTK